MKPYVYIATGKSKDVRREAPTGARVAVHFPDLGRSLEVWVDEHGRYSVDETPAPGHGGQRVEVARGQLPRAQ